MKNFLVHSDEVKKEMLNSINVKSIEDLFKQIPQKARMGELGFENPLSEMEVQKGLNPLLKKIILIL